MEDINIRLAHPSYNSNEQLFFNYFIQKSVDTVIIGSNGRLKAHGTLLAEKNHIFKSLLASQENKEEKVVNLPQFSVEVLAVIIEFLYRGESRYYKEIEKEVKTAILYFFETPETLLDSDCIEIRPIVPVVILSDSDNDDICDSSRSDTGNVKNKISIQQAVRTKSPSHKRIISSDAIINSTSKQNGHKSKKKKRILQSKSVIQSKPPQSNNNESIVQLSPLKHLSQISVSRKKKLEAPKVIKIDLFKNYRETDKGLTISNKRHVNPFASPIIKFSNLDTPIQKEYLNAKNTTVNILDHTIVEPLIIEEPVTQSPDFLIDEPMIYIESCTNPGIVDSRFLESLDEFSKSLNQESTHIDCASAQELEAVLNQFKSTSDVLTEAQTSTKEATTSRDQSKTSPVLTNKESSNKSERKRIAVDSSDNEDSPPRKRSSKWKIKPLTKKKEAR